MEDVCKGIATTVPDPVEGTEVLIVKHHATHVAQPAKMECLKAVRAMVDAGASQPTKTPRLIVAEGCQGMSQEAKATAAPVRSMTRCIQRKRSRESGHPPLKHFLSTALPSAYTTLATGESFLLYDNIDDLLEGGIDDENEEDVST